MKVAELFEAEVKPAIDMSVNERGLTSLDRLDISGGIVTSDFIVTRNQISSLKNGPSEVHGEFRCAHNELSSLEFCPTIVADDFKCSNNQLTSLEFCPSKINGVFDCSSQKYRSLSSLENGPTEVKSNYYCNENPEITSLAGIASKIGKNLFCDGCGITSLQGIHKLFKGGYIGGFIQIDNNPITSHILGLILIPKLQSVAIESGNKKLIAAADIINKHLAGGRDVIDCQQELIDAGLKEYAQL